MQIDLNSGREKYSLKYIFIRATWAVVWFLFGRFGPRLLSPLRVFLLRLFGASIGKKNLLCGGIKILIPWNLEIGDRSAIGAGVNIYNFSKITIGSDVSVSSGAWLCTGSHDYTKSSMPLVSKPIVIRDSVWIASDVFLAPGITIDVGAVIAARSVVVKSMPSWFFCAGHPCKPLKQRELNS